jgi:hypothetical protein
MVTGSTTRVSVAGNGAQTAGDTVFNPVALSADGQRVAFTFPEVGLVPNGSPVKVDTFVHDLGTGATTTTSVASDGTATYADGNAAAISPDGGFVAFDALFLGAAQVDGLPSPGVFLRTLG